METVSCEHKTDIALQKESIAVGHKGWVIVKINHYHDSTGAYHDSKYYHNSTNIIKINVDRSSTAVLV